MFLTVSISILGKSNTSSSSVDNVKLSINHCLAFSSEHFNTWATKRHKGPFVEQAKQLKVPNGTSFKVSTQTIPQEGCSSWPSAWKGQQTI